MPVIFIGGSPRITLFFIGLLLFFQFFNHIMDYYSGDYSSSSQDYYNSDLGYTDTKTFTFPRKILSIPSSRLLNRFKISHSSSGPSTSTMNHYSTVLLTSNKFLEKDFQIETNVDGTSERVNFHSDELRFRDDVFVKVVLEEDTFLRGDSTLGSMAKVQVFSLKNSNDMKYMSVDDLDSVTLDTPLSWEIEYEETLMDSKIYFTRKGTSQFNKDCIYVVTEHRNISLDSLDRISKTMELRKFCPQQTRNRFFNLTNFALEISSIADTSLDEDCAIISFSDDLYEFRIICFNGTSLFHGPSTYYSELFNKSSKIPKVKDLHDVLSIHELNTRDSPNSVFTLKEHSDIDDLRNQLYYSMYDHVTKRGPQVQLHLYHLNTNTQHENWVHERLDHSISGSMTAIYSRNAHRLHDVYYKGVEISHQSENGKVVVFPLHGGALYVMRANAMGGMTIDKSTYYSFVGNGFGLYDLRTLQERYYAQDHFSLALFEAMKKRMEKYSHPNQVAINVDGSYIIVVHYQLFAFVFKQAGKGLALQSVLKNVHFTRENSHLKSSVMAIQSLHFVKRGVVAALCEDGSMELYDVEHESNVNPYSSEGKSEENAERTFKSWILYEFLDKPVFYSVLILMIGMFMYNEYMIRKRIQAHRAQYQQQQQAQQQTTSSTTN
ncbi:hypothetical protein C9374_011252 [Naegleria lovaniensis]|uniref:Uncharacterized protein n=1 Tax=Naegleria lovaniensis TaxID=51637 RepID=A0AA88KQP3_NAELO|nr:uncharacterized protein C9374_011252 [Naegleria lovaniensis]KAG2392527.1 hypothetical protein C9374_011252 [Naegleria lovaniensis]